MESREDYSVGVIPVYRDADGSHLFCLVREADGHWGFPKGHVDVGEAEERAAQRELQEETGIKSVELNTSHPFSEQYEFERAGAHVHKTVKYFLGMVGDTKTATPANFAQEIQEVKWLGYEEAKNTITFPEAKRLLDEVWEYLKKPLE